MFADMQHSQQYISLYQEVIFLSWGGRILHKVESLMMILLSASVASLSPSYSVGITRLLQPSHTDTCNNNFGTSFIYIPSMGT